MASGLGNEGEGLGGYRGIYGEENGSYSTIVFRRVSGGLSPYPK